MEITEGSTAHAMAILAMDRAEALDRTTVQMQATLRQELLDGQAILRKEAAALQAILRQEAGILEGLRQEIQRSVVELKALQPGIERSAGTGVRNAIAEGMSDLRRDLGTQVSETAQVIKDAGQDVKGIVRRLKPLWAGLIAAGGLVFGMVLMYFVMAPGQGRIERKIDQLQASIAAAQPPAVVTPPSIGLGRVRPKPHGSSALAAKPKTQQEEPAPSVPNQP